MNNVCINITRINPFLAATHPGTNVFMDNFKVIRNNY